MDAVLTLTLIRRQESASEDLRGTPAAPPAGPQTGSQTAHQRELLAYQQPHTSVSLAGTLPSASTWKIYARWFLLGHGYTGQ